MINYDCIVLKTCLYRLDSTSASDTSCSTVVSVTNQISIKIMKITSKFLLKSLILCEV